MNKGKEKIVYAIIIIILIAIFVGAYFLLDKLILKKDNKKEEYKKQITTEEVIETMTSNGLSKYDTSQVLKNTNQKASYIFLNINRDYEIIYGNFDNIELAKNNYNTNFNLMNGKYSNLVEITKNENEEYAKYEAENSTNYIVIMRIGTSYFQVETTKNNKESVRSIFSKLEN